MNTAYLFLFLAIVLYDSQPATEHPQPRFAQLPWSILSRNWELDFSLRWTYSTVSPGWTCRGLMEANQQPQPGALCSINRVGNWLTSLLGVLDTNWDKEYHSLIPNMSMDAMDMLICGWRIPDAVDFLGMKPASFFVDFFVGHLWDILYAAGMLSCQTVSYPMSAASACWITKPGNPPNEFCKKETIDDQTFATLITSAVQCLLGYSESMASDFKHNRFTTP